MGIALTHKEFEEFELKATKAKMHRREKLDKKRNSHLELIITLFFVFLFCALITCVIWHSLQMYFYCGFGLVCLIGLFDEQIYDMRKKEIINSFQGPDRI